MAARCIATVAYFVVLVAIGSFPRPIRLGRLFGFMQFSVSQCLLGTKLLLLLALQLVNGQPKTYLCPLAFQPYPLDSPSCVDQPIRVVSAAGCRTQITVRASIYPVPSVQQIIIPALPPGATLRLEGLIPESQQYSTQDLSSYMVGYNATFDWTPQLEHAGKLHISTIHIF